MYSFEVAIIGLYFFMRTPSMRFYNKKLLDKFLGGGVYFFLLLFLMESLRRTLPEMASKFFSQVRVANFLIKPPLLISLKSGIKSQIGC